MSSVPSPLAATAAATAIPRRRAPLLAAAAGWLLCSVLYFGTAQGVKVKESDLHNAWHHYEYLVDGFLSGHLYLSLPPSPELMALPDPYDPLRNRPYRLWDASLYEGKYYLYYGPTPALLVMLPYKVITGSHLSQRVTTAVFAAAGLAALALLLVALQRRLYPNASAAVVFWAVVLVGHTCWLPVVLRRPAFWELPTVAAAALCWWALYGLLRYHETGGRPRWAVFTGVMLALTLGSRPTYLFAAAVIVALFGWPWPRPRGLLDFMRRVWPAALPLALGIAALLAYNHARFGAWFEFGQKYQLWGMEERTATHFSLGYVPFNLWLYVLSIPEFSPYFPFVRTAWSNVLPTGYIATEEMHGILFAMPAVLLGVVALATAWRQRRRASAVEATAWPVLAAAAATTLLGAGILFCFAGACSRYILELLAGWSLLVGVGFLAVFGGGAPRLARLATLAAVVWSLAYVWLASFEFRSFARVTQPKLYAALAHTLNYPSEWVARQQHQAFGPLDLDVTLARAAPGTSTVLVAAGRHDEVNQLVLVRIDADHVSLRLQMNNFYILDTGPIAVKGAALHVRCAAPWLYPPAAHPFWDAFPPAQAFEGQHLFEIEAGSVHVARLADWMFDPMRFDPVVRTAEYAAGRSAWVSRWQHLPAATGGNNPPSHAAEHP